MIVHQNSVLPISLPCTVCLLILTSPSAAFFYQYLTFWRENRWQTRPSKYKYLQTPVLCRAPESDRHILKVCFKSDFREISFPPYLGHEAPLALTCSVAFLQFEKLLLGLSLVCKFGSFAQLGRLNLVIGKGIKTEENGRLCSQLRVLQIGTPADLKTVFELSALSIVLLIHTPRSGAQSTRHCVSYALTCQRPE